MEMNTAVGYGLGDREERPRWFKLFKLFKMLVLVMLMLMMVQIVQIDDGGKQELGRKEGEECTILCIVQWCL